MSQLQRYKCAFKNIVSLGLPDESLPSDAVDNPEEIVDKLQQNVGNIPPDHLSQMRSEATASHDSITRLEDRVSYLDNTVEDLITTVNNTEAWLKEWNMLIHGLKDIPPRPTDKKELKTYEFKFIEYVCDKLNSLMGTRLYRPLEPWPTFQ